MSIPKDGPALKNGWARFWFTPGDPSMLGLMRIVVGTLALYTFIVFSLDLRTFFGPHAFWDLKGVDLERKNFPYVVQPHSWEELTANFRPPEAPHRKKAVMDFVRALPDKVADREFQLEYLTKLVPPDPIEVMRAMSFIDRLPRDPVDRSKRLELIATLAPDPENPSQEIPPFLQNLPMVPPDIREAARAAVVRFTKLLPNDDPDAKRWVLDYFQEMTVPSRQRALDFLRRLPENPVERAKIVDYVDEWLVDPSQVYAVGKPVWSLYYHVTSPTGMWVVHLSTIFVIGLFTIGLWTRVTSIMAWMMMVMYIHRSELVLFGMDTMMNVLMIYLMFAPSGAALSIDRLLERRRLWRFHLAKGGPMDPEIRDRLARPRQSVSANFVTRLIQIHFCFIYMASGLAKLKGDAWWTADALWGTMINAEFCPFPLPGYEQSLAWIARNRPLYAMFMSGGVAFTFMMEIGLPFLIWTRLRPYMVIGALFLHTGIAFFMGLTVFSLLMFTLLLSYLPPSLIHDRFNMGILPRLKLRYSPRVPEQVDVASRWGAFDTGHQIEFVAEDGPMLLTTPDGQTHQGHNLGQQAFRQLGLLRGWGFLGLLFAPRFSTTAQLTTKSKT